MKRKSLFGFTSDTESYRSRLSFKDAVIDKSVTEEEKRTLVLGEPKPTSYLDYLTGKRGEPATYRDEFSLRGLKQYWLHTAESKGEAGRNKEVGSDIYAYSSGTSFTGQIRFTNLQREELGMLLWSLLLEKNSQQNIGKGKPYGYGRICVSLKHLKIQDPEKLYGGGTLCLEPYQEQKESCETYISEAKADMEQFLGRDVMKYPPIRDFLLMKNAEEMPQEDQIRYMHLSDRQKNWESEHQARMAQQEMLPTVGVVLGKEKKKISHSDSRERYKNENGNGYRGSERSRQNRDRRLENNQGNRKETESRDYSSGGNATTSVGDFLKDLNLTD